MLILTQFPNKCTRRVILGTMRCRLKFQCHREHFTLCWNTSSGPISVSLIICSGFMALSTHLDPIYEGVKGFFILCVEFTPDPDWRRSKMGEMCGVEENWVCRFVGALAWDDLCNVSLSSVLCVIRRTARYYFQRGRTVYGKFFGEALNRWT